MPLIPFPDVPAYPGVPSIPRAVNAALPPQLTVALGTVQSILASAFQNPTLWGIFDQFGNQLGVLSPGLSAGAALLADITGASAPTLSTVSFDFIRETRISDFILEAGSFANYNKVQLPANPVVTLAFTGSQDDRTSFLNLLNAACISTDLYSVVTPEVTYVNYNMERYTYSRKAVKGATLIVAEISMKEIRQVSAAFTTVTPITQPQNPAATPPTDSGLVQPAAPDQSTLKSIFNKLGIS